MKDYYSIIGVSRNVSQDVLEAVYNKNLANNKSGEELKEINEAYEVLSDPNKRSEYDKIFDSTFLSNSMNENVINLDNYTESGTRNAKPKVSKTKVILILLIVILVGWLLKNCVTGNNTLWGTYESDTGDLVTIEKLKDYGDDIYSAYIASSDNPWIKEYITVNLSSGQMTYPVSMNSFSFELKNKKLTLSNTQKTYKKISDNCKYDEILSKEEMSSNDIVGLYTNAASYSIVIEEADRPSLVNVYFYDNLGVGIAERESISYNDFYCNNKVNIPVENENHSIYFEHRNLLVCDAFFDGFIKVNRYSNNTTSSEQDTDVSSKDLLSLDIIQEYTSPLITGGAHKIKDMLGSSLIEINDFYLSFDLNKQNQDINKINGRILYKYIYRSEDEFEGKQYGSAIVEGSFDGTTINLNHVDDKETDAMDSEVWAIVQGYDGDYQRLNEDRNDCWCSIIEENEINYIYANWNMPEVFENIVKDSKTSITSQNKNGQRYFVSLFKRASYQYRYL